MLAFSRKWIEPIRAGTKTVTLRKWPSPRVRAGGVYEAVTVGFPRTTFATLEVTGLRRIKLGDVDEALATRDGARFAAEVRAYWRKQGFELGDALWLVEFRLR